MHFERDHSKSVRAGWRGTEGHVDGDVQDGDWLLDANVGEENAHISG